jgi:hypothetical protein
MSITLGTRYALLAKTADYSKKILATSYGNLIGYWPLAEVSGSTITDLSSRSHNGTATGFDLLYPGIGDGRSCPNLDGVNDNGNIYSAGLASDFDGQEGAVSLWLRVSGVGVWSDATFRNSLTLRVDANNQLLVRKSTTNNILQGLYIAGGTTKTVNITTSSIGWLHLAITWSKSGDQVGVYLNGALQGSLLTGLGTWAGSLASNSAVIGAVSTTPTNVWSGTIAHVALWTTPLSTAQIANLARLT